MKHIGLAILFGLMAVGLMGAVLAPSSAQAQPNALITVNSTLDEVDATPGDGVCASTPSGQCTLRAAIMEANALAGADTIDLPAGGYTLTIAGTQENAGAVGDLDLFGGLTINGVGTTTTIIDGNKLDRVFDVIGSGVVISGAAIQGGQNPGTSVGEGGGGIRSAAGGFTLLNSIVRHNSSSDGGGIYNSNGLLTVSNSTVYSNTSANAGGGIYNNSSATLLIITSTVNSNNEGGIFNYQGALTVVDSIVSRNVGSSGGGIANYYGAQATIVNSSIFSNTSGGMYEPGGGGIYSVGAVLTMTNSTVSGNSAEAYGGGLYNYLVGDGRVYLYNVTFANNIADANSDGIGDGGGVMNNFGHIYASNTIFGGNSDLGGQAPDFRGILNSQGYNFIQTTVGYTLTGVLTGVITSTIPNLGPLQDNGGPTLTHALLPGSPAIDAGDPAGCEDALGNLLMGDQRGFIRAADGDSNGSAICDIGAFEYGSIPLLHLFLPLILR